MMVSLRRPTTLRKTGTTSAPTEVATGVAKQCLKQCVEPWSASDFFEGHNRYHREYGWSICSSGCGSGNRNECRKHVNTAVVVLFHFCFAPASVILPVYLPTTPMSLT